MKGLTSRKLLMENRGLNKAFWGRHLWARGYYVASTGNVSEEMIARYIENQEAERDRDAPPDFQSGGGSAQGFLTGEEVNVVVK